MDSRRERPNRILEKRPMGQAGMFDKIKDLANGMAEYREF
jgi:hypothetical protein